MSPPLNTCMITGPSKHLTSAFAVVAASLRYQSTALGLRWNASDAQPTERQISCMLQMPDAAPIACEINGWPDTTAGGATEIIVQAAAGLMSVHGRASGRAQPLGVNFVSTLTATLALQGVLAVAIGQRRGMSLAHTSVSLASSALLSVGQYLAGASVSEAPEQLFPGRSSVTPGPPFISADGVIFELETLDALPWRAFWCAIGIDAHDADQGWQSFLLRYAKAIAPLPDALMAALAQLPYAQIAAICTHHGVSICPVRSLEARCHDLDARRLWQQGPWSFRYGAMASNWRDRPHTQCGSAATMLPLSGLTVIESCRRIQGPLAGHLLALLGADVIRIEAPGGDPLRGMPPMIEGVSARFDALNRYKTVREIDIKSAGGRAEIYALARQADVFLHNWAPGKAASLQLDQADLQRINPSLVYAYAGGWGAQARSDLPGTDFMAQAYSGVAGKIAAASGAPGGSLLTVLDVLGGAVAAQGITAALLNRCMYAAGVAVESSLLGAATLLCAQELDVLWHACPLAIGITDQPLSAIYPTQQGLIAIDCGNDPKTIAKLAQALGVSERTDIPACLGPVLLCKTAAQWLTLLRLRDIPAAIVIEDLTDLYRDERMRSSLTMDAYLRVNSPWRFT